MDIKQFITEPVEQWAMSAADNVYGMSLPEYHPAESVTYDNLFAAEDTDTSTPDVDWAEFLNKLFADRPRYTPLQAADISSVIAQFIKPNEKTLAKAHINMFGGALLKTIASAGDFFSSATGLAMGSIANINKQKSIGVQNYQNEMDAIDNQVMYAKHQLADRFNKIVETNIMNMAARNLRVTSGNVLELTKDSAQEITEDIQTLESNARLKKIALEAGKKQIKESAKYAKQQLWTGFAQSAIKLGLNVATAGGTGESWGNLYKNYDKSKKFLDALETEELNKLY